MDKSLGLSGHMLCDNGHPLTRLKLKEQWYRGRTGKHTKRCNVCQKVLGRKTPRWKCEKSCAFNCCQDCYEKSAFDTVQAKAASHEDYKDDEGGRNRASTAVSILPLIASLAGEEMSDSDGETEDSKAVCCGCWPMTSSRPASQSDYSQLSSGTSSGVLSLPVAEKMADDEMVGDENAVVEPSTSSILTRTVTVQLFANVKTAPAIGGLDISRPHSEFVLPPEAVLFEPSEADIGKPSLEAGTPGKRMIFLNTTLTKREQDGLRELHEALAGEDQVTASGDRDFPEFVSIHALRILQQAKFDTKKALSIMLTHLNMRVKCFPLRDDDLARDLKKGLMYWHGRDRNCRPCLVWRLERMDGFTKDGAVKLVLFILEYAVRYLLVPGRVENWILIVDLENVGLSHAGSAGREIAKNCAVLLEQVYCGRNFQTKIMSLPWVVKSIVNSFIPADKKEKVHFVGASELQSNMAQLFEPHQLEKRYGGTSPDLTAEEVYPFHFFPNCTGKSSSADSVETSLHTYTNREFHEGFLLDESTASAKAKWVDQVQEQSLTPATARDLQSIGIQDAKACTDIDSWKLRVNPEDAKHLN